MAELTPEQKMAIAVNFSTGSVMKAARAVHVDDSTIRRWRQLEAWKVEWARLEKQQEQDLSEMIRHAKTVGVRQLIYVAEGKNPTGRRKDPDTTPAARATAAAALAKISGIEPAQRHEHSGSIAIEDMTDEQIAARRAELAAKRALRGA